MGHWGPRYVARWASLSLVAIGLLVASVACGQPDTPQPRVGAALAAVTPGIPTFTATPNHPPSAIAATQTAFANLPTRPGPDSPLAPVIEATLALPRPTTNPLVPEKPTAAVPTFQSYDPAEPCRVATVGDGPSLAVTTVSAGEILIGRVVEISTARWSTPDGQRPARPCIGPPFYRIYTPIAIRVEQTAKGQPQTTDRIVEAYGGTVGQDSFRYIEQGGEPNTFQIGERVLLFLNNSSVIGRYDIRADGTVVDRYYPYESTNMPQLLSDIAAITDRHRSGATPTRPASVVPARP